MKQKTRRNYTREFKLETIRQVTGSHKTIAEVSRDLGINNNVVRRWCKEHEDLEALPQTDASKDEEIRRLRTELASVKEDAEILKNRPRATTPHRIETQIPVH